MGEVSYSLIPPDRFEDVIQLLRNNFFADEPLNQSLSLCKLGEPHVELEEYSLNVLRQNMSSMATIGPDQKVVGASLLGCPVNDQTKKEYQDPKYQKIITFIRNMADEVDLSHECDLSEIIDWKILSVDNRMRGKGVGCQLYEHTEQIAREKGFKLMRAEATALFSQKIMEKNGWETVREIKYSDYPSPSNPMFPVAPPHDTFKIMIKRLN